MKLKQSSLIDWKKFNILSIPAWDQSIREAQVSYHFENGTHQYQCHFPLDALGGETDILIEIQELESDKIKGSYSQNNHGEKNPLLKKIEGELILKENHEEGLTLLHTQDNRQKIWTLSKSKKHKL